MSIKFATSNLKNVEHAVYNIDNFNGVDYTTTPTNVDSSRAIEISNYLPKGNSLRKRKGWKALNVDLADSYEIVNIFLYEDEYLITTRDKEHRNRMRVWVTDDVKTVGFGEYQFNENVYMITEGSYDNDVNYSGYGFEKDKHFFIYTGETILVVSYTISDNVRHYSVTDIDSVAYIPTIAYEIYDVASGITNEKFEDFNIMRNLVYARLVFDFNQGTFTPVSGGYKWSMEGKFDLTSLFPQKDAYYQAFKGRSGMMERNVFEESTTVAPSAHTSGAISLVMSLWSRSSISCLIFSRSHSRPAATYSL